MNEVETKVKELRESLQGWKFILLMVDEKNDTCTIGVGKCDEGDALSFVKTIFKRFNLNPYAAAFAIDAILREEAERN